MTEINNDDQKTAPADATLSANDESREEKLRRAKIAMEGLDRTVRREAVEQEEEASAEKQQLNKLLTSLNHEKELIELTWVNLDDKRAGMKKALEPVLDAEDKIQSAETELESKEEVTIAAADRRPIEEARWANQEKRHQTEQEKWLVEEKIAKVEQQIAELKTKYQELINQEEEIRDKIQAIDEQLLLQQEVLRQQRELTEQKKRQEALRQIEERKRRAEAAAIKSAATPAPTPTTAPVPAPPVAATIDETAAATLKKIAALRQQEEAKQRQETARFQSTAVPTPEVAPVAPTDDEADEKRNAIKRALELERIKKENEEAEKARQDLKPGTKTVLGEMKENADDSLIKPLRTLRGDLDEAVKNQQVDEADLARLNKKTFPWFKK